MKYAGIFHSRDVISEFYQVIGEWEVWIGFKKIKIKITQNDKEQYFYTNSSHYWGSKQAGPYTSSINGFDTAEKAIKGALQELTSFYDPNDDNAQWVDNEDY